MRVSYLLATGALAGVLALGGCKKADNTGRGGSGSAGTEQSSSKESSKKGQKQARGDLVRGSEQEVVISVPQGGSVALQVDPNTVVMLDGQKVAVAQIPAGSQVNATYSEKGNNRKASRIDATSSTGGGAQTGQQPQGSQSQGSQQQHGQPY